MTPHSTRTLSSYLVRALSPQTRAIGTVCVLCLGVAVTVKIEPVKVITEGVSSHSVSDKVFPTLHPLHYVCWCCLHYMCWCCLHYIYTVYWCCLHYMYTVYWCCLHYMYTVYWCCLHYMYIHCVLVLSSLHVHCVLVTAVFCLFSLVGTKMRGLARTGSKPPDGFMAPR